MKGSHISNSFAKRLLMEKNSHTFVLLKKITANAQDARFSRVVLPFSGWEISSQILKDFVKFCSLKPAHNWSSCAKKMLQP